MHHFAAATFDAAVSHFGIMFFDDPVAAFANIGRALRPGGRLTFVCPPGEWYVAPLTAILGRAATAIRDALVPAGFIAIRATPLARPLHFGPDLATATRFYAGSGPVPAILERPSAPTEAEAREILDAALRPEPRRHADPRRILHR